MLLLNRLPKGGQIISVYAVAVTILFSWASIAAIRDFSSNWSLYLNVSDILGLFAYVMAGAFLESLLLIAALLLISLILPPKIFADKFILYGTILTVTFLGSIMFLYTQTLTYGVLENINNGGVFFASSTFMFVVLAKLSQFFARIVESFADRCVVFLYIYLPLSLISVIVIFARNVN